jgi:hypothetical protein
MTAVFDRAAEAWDYQAVVPGVLRTTKLPLPATTAEEAPSTGVDEGRHARPLHDAAYWAAKTEGMDFSAEDRIDTPRFNRILWTGLMGDNVAFPQNPKAANLRRHRGSLLRRYPGLKQTGTRTENDHGAGDAR